MAIHTSHAPGTFCWPELYTTDQNGAKAFYSALFGWTVRDLPMGPDRMYTVFAKNRADAAACYGTLPEMEAKGIPSHWMSYVAVTSADEAAARVTANGGAVLKEPFDVPGMGRMAALRDPCGAAFCVWEAKGHIGVSVMGEPNTLTWTELMTRETEKSAAFYGAVFSWGRQAWPMADGSTYVLFTRGETPAGGMMKITPDMGTVPNCWRVYFQVETCDAVVAECLKLDGSISVPAQDVPGVGRFAFLIDPSGAHFGIMQAEAKS